VDLTPRRLIAAAEAIVVARLRGRTRQALLDSSKLQLGNRQLEMLADAAAQLSAIIGVDTDYLRFEDKLGAILRVNDDELPADIRPLLRKFAFPDFIVVHGLEIFDYLERSTARNRRMLSHPAFIPLPQTEDEWIDRIMSMTISDLLEAASIPDVTPKV
jgi:hypothetical protein